MFPEDLNCAGRYCFVMTTKHPFSPTWSCFISHYCFFCLYFFLLKYIVKFNIQYKKIFISLSISLHSMCCTCRLLSIILKQNKRFSYKCKNYCLMWDGAQFWARVTFLAVSLGVTWPAGIAFPAQSHSSVQQRTLWLTIMSVLIAHCTNFTLN